MVWCDRIIEERGPNFIEPFSRKAVTSIAYDLKTDTFASEPGNESKIIELKPGESVFVKSEESFKIPSNVIIYVTLRNSRIRQGLSLEAPIYYPGHHTKIFFRITNNSKNSIVLDNQKGIASVLFGELDGDVSNPYDGAFQREFDFSGMASYSSMLSEDITNIEEKVEQVKEIEKNIYGNVLAIMAVFVGIFSIININLQNASLDMRDLISLDLTTVGAIGFLIAAINSVLPGKSYSHRVWIACVIAFLAAAIMQFI
ncbi:MAG: hypothetical protein IJ679_08285 [Lachnospiraceae bacterium]|nr:hypothetical protein [Lachnospiraceae bacterium]